MVILSRKLLDTSQYFQIFFVNDFVISKFKIKQLRVAIFGKGTHDLQRNENYDSKPL